MRIFLQILFELFSPLVIQDGIPEFPNLPSPSTMIECVFHPLQKTQVRPRFNVT